MGMLEARQDVALSNEAFLKIRTSRTRDRELERQISLESPIGSSRQPHVGHPTCAEDPDQLVGPDPRPNARSAGGESRRFASGDDRRERIELLEPMKLDLPWQQRLAQSQCEVVVLLGQSLEPGCALSGIEQQRFVEKTAHPCHLVNR
jgi:hypothetical protein